MRILRDFLFGKNGGATHGDWARLVRRESFSDFLPWVAWDEEARCYLNHDESIGYLWECTPLAFVGSKDLRVLEGLLRLAFPHNTVLQVVLYADPDITPFLDHFRASKTRPNPLSQRSVEAFAAFFQAGTAGLTACAGIPVRNFRCFVALKVSEPMDEHDLIQIEDSLTGLGMAPRWLKPEALVALMKKLFNAHCAPSCSLDPLKPLRKQMILAETRIEDGTHSLRLGERYARCLTPKNLPAETDALETNTLGGGIRGMLEDASQINGPFLWSLNILFDEKVEQKIKTQASIMMMQRATGSFAVQVQKRNEEYTWALSQLSDKVRFVRIIPSVVVLGSSEQAVSVATSRARRLWEARGYEMQEETLMRRTLFLATLPLGLQTQLATLKVLDRDFPVPTLVAARLMPVQADFRGVDDNPVVPYVGRKGQAVGIDVFHPGSNNHNFLVCATSGSGKSFSMNHLLSNYYASGAKVRVVDLGYSYQKLCRAVSGRFLDYGERALVINPFHSNAKDEEDRKNDENATLHVLAEMVYSSSDQKLTEIEWTLLKEAVRYAYETDPIQGIDAASRYLAEFPRHASAEMKAFEDVSRLSARALAFNLSDFRSKGVYGHYFNGPSLFDIASDDFVVLELEKLKPKKELFRVIVLQVMNAITQDLYLSDRGNRRFILFEEAWAFFHAGNHLGSVIEEGYRRARKYTGSFGIVTQSLLDFEKFGPSGQVILENSAYKFFLESSSYRKAAAKNLLDYEGLALDLLEGIKNNKPRYSELFVETPYGRGPVRLVVDAWNYWVSTSAGEDVNRFMTLLAQSGDVVDVIEQLSGSKKSGERDAVA